MAAGTPHNDHDNVIYNKIIGECLAHGRMLTVTVIKLLRHALNNIIPVSCEGVLVTMSVHEHSYRVGRTGGLTMSYEYYMHTHLQ